MPINLADFAKNISVSFTALLAFGSMMHTQKAKIERVKKTALLSMGSLLLCNMHHCMHGVSQNE